MDGTQTLSGSWRRQQQILVNGHYQSLTEPVPDDATITIAFAAPAPVIAPVVAPIKIAYADQRVIVALKPAGLKTHPSAVGDTDSLIGRVAAHFNGAPIYITHRLDMATSGLILLARDPLTQAIINRELATKTLRRTYTALVTPGMTQNWGRIDAPIAHRPDDIRRRMVGTDGLPATTFYRVQSRTTRYDRITLRLATGRTHQIRVHMDFIGHPLLGDPLYGHAPADRLMLHATTLTWQKPLSTRTQTVTSTVPF
ncbi:RluA family pseudouridine synthase [Lacticaseibacillus thailandensis]|uniref:RluA family pseudouridine synthase n=1 Tax=Lacticaseibacillus thailandensis TaxID=381741 RepID=UPI0006D0321C|nr:RluA family pseudouridine synthase [Lacticaseibacillus thailandensis]